MKKYLLLLFLFLPLRQVLAQAPPAGSITLYSNTMETAVTYAGGTLVTTPAPHGGLKSEQRPATGVLHGSVLGARNFALPAAVSNLTYRVWVTDNNHATQKYSLSVRFRNPTNNTYSSYYSTSWIGAGTTWTLMSGDFTTVANTSIAAGYTELSQIYLRAWNGGGAAPPPYVTYYADDATVEC